MTEAGHAAFARAEEIFQLGELIAEEVREASSGKTVRLAVGMSDGLSKLAAHALLAPVLNEPSLRLVCHEGELEQLTGVAQLMPFVTDRAPVDRHGRAAADAATEPDLVAAGTRKRDGRAYGALTAPWRDQ